VCSGCTCIVWTECVLTSSEQQKHTHIYIYIYYTFKYIYASIHRHQYEYSCTGDDKYANMCIHILVYTYLNIQICVYEYMYTGDYTAREQYRQWEEATERNADAAFLQRNSFAVSRDPSPQSRLLHQTAPDKSGTEKQFQKKSFLFSRILAPQSALRSCCKVHFVAMSPHTLVCCTRRRSARIIETKISKGESSLFENCLSTVSSIGMPIVV